MVVPYVVLALTPVLSGWLSQRILDGQPDCGADEPAWQLQDFQVALLPGVLDFLPFLWLLSGSAAVRRSAVIAGGVGAVRFAIPQAFTLVEHAVRGGPTSDDCTISIFFLLVLIPLMLLLWAISALIAVLKVIRVSRTPYP